MKKNSKQEKDIYFVKLNYHRNIKEVIETHYNIKVLWTEVIAWGYSTISIYMEDVDKNKYIVKTTFYTETNERNNPTEHLSLSNRNKISKIQKSVQIEHFLHDRFPTPHYLSNKENEYITHVQTPDLNVLVRLQHHIEGIPPFDMNLDIYTQMLEVLKKLHHIKLPPFELPRYKMKKGIKPLFLHGDLTPSNVLISYGNITGIIDFEECLIGPAEYDLARTMIFSMYHMQEVKLSEMLEFTRKTYAENIDEKFLLELAQLHLLERLHNLDKNKEKYKNTEDWKADKKFTQEKLEMVKKHVPDLRT